MGPRAGEESPVGTDRRRSLARRAAEGAGGRLRFALWRRPRSSACRCGSRPVIVLLPVYNGGRYFEAALDSVLAQSHRATSIHVLDNCSTDGTLDAAMKRATTDDRITVHRSSQNHGMVNNFRRGLELVDNEFCLMLMADDVLRSDAVEKLVVALARDERASVAVPGRVHLWRSNVLTLSAFEARNLHSLEGSQPGPKVAKEIVTRCVNLVGEPSGVMFRAPKHLAERRGMLRFGGADFYCNIDVSMWLHLLTRGNATFLPEPLVAIRQHAGREQHRPLAAIAGAVEWFTIAEAAHRTGLLDAASRAQALKCAGAIGHGVLQRLAGSLDPDVEVEVLRLLRLLDADER